MTEQPDTHTGPASQPSTERCRCGHLKGDHSGRRDHQEKGHTARPWCHACETSCLHDPTAAPSAPAAEPSVRDTMGPADGRQKMRLLDRLHASTTPVEEPADTDLRDRFAGVLAYAEQVAATSGPGPASAVQAVIDRLRAALANEAQQAAPCEQHPNAPTFDGKCGGCTQYPADMIKVQPAETVHGCPPDGSGPIAEADRG